MILQKFCHFCTTSETYQKRKFTRIAGRWFSSQQHSAATTVFPDSSENPVHVIEEQILRERERQTCKPSNAFKNNQKGNATASTKLPRHLWRQIELLASLRGKSKWLRAARLFFADLWSEMKWANAQSLQDVPAARLEKYTSMLTFGWKLVQSW